MPGENTGPTPPRRPPGTLGESSHGRIDATSNFCLPAAALAEAGAVIAPASTGATRAATATRLSATRRVRLSRAPIRFARIALTRFFRSDPVTPDTHASGDSA